MSLDVQRCGICRKLFQYGGIGPVLCPGCREQDEEDFQRVKNYLRDNPGRTVVETAKACEVDPDRIRAWLKDERLEFTGDGNTGLFCEKCGAAIASGTICDDCRMALSRAAGELMRSIERPTAEQKVVSKGKDRMRFLGRK
ncbi:MAG: flagellar protein [Lachnospiraceae bacterium]|nr:flagellar protein [Lachnospiraceae bacterium]